MGGTPKTDIARKGLLMKIPPEILRDVLQQELQDGTVVADSISERRCIFLGHLWNAEKVIAEQLNAKSVEFGTRIRISFACSTSRYRRVLTAERKERQDDSALPEPRSRCATTVADLHPARR